jgi:hypothetical protein
MVTYLHHPNAEGVLAGLQAFQGFLFEDGVTGRRLMGCSICSRQRLLKDFRQHRRAHAGRHGFGWNIWHRG